MNIALIVAAGKGVRMENTTPKQFIQVMGKPLLYYSIKAFQDNKQIDYIVVATNEEYVQMTKNLCEKYKLNKVRGVTKGGETRQQSVFNGLSFIKSLDANDNSIILIHDAARPLVSQKIIDDNIAACKKHDAVVTAIKVVDTTIKGENNISDFLNRDELYQEQTPQTFRLGLILDAHNKVKENVTDDAKLAVKTGHDVQIVEGSKFNFKVTTPEDLIILEGLIKKDTH